MEKCTAPVESAAHWITLQTVPLGPSCREKSPPYLALVEQELHRLLHLELEQDLGLDLQVHLRLGVDLPVELEVEMSPSRKRERRDSGFLGNQDPTQQKRCIVRPEEISALDPDTDRSSGEVT